MDKMTSEGYHTTEDKTFVDIYKSLPDRSVVVAPKTKFVRHIASITKKSAHTVRMWIANEQKPDALTQSVIAKDLNVPENILFPADHDTDE